MPRPKKCRRVAAEPRAAMFKPQGAPLMGLPEVVLPVEGLEALRLADVEGMDHEAAAQAMDVSRPTFSRILADAHELVGKALVNGWALRIEGGQYELAPGRGGRGRGGRGGRGMGGGRGGGRGRGQGAGPGRGRGERAMRIPIETEDDDAQS